MDLSIGMNFIKNLILGNIYRNPDIIFLSDVN